VIDSLLLSLVERSYSNTMELRLHDLRPG